MSMQIALFPLHTVLFPGGTLSLRVFETRYIDMVRDCLREDRPFGVCLIREGQEVGGNARPHEVGTLARILDSGTRSDGLLGILTQGEQRFRILSLQDRPDKLLLGEIEPVADKPEACGEPLAPLAGLLESLLAVDPERLPPVRWRLDDPVWVVYRLAERLPIRLVERQQVLDSDDIDSALRVLREAVDRLGISLN